MNGMVPGNKLTKNMVLSQFVKIWGGLYDYSKVEYTNNLTKVVVICKIHGDFLTTPKDHKRNNPSGGATGCPKCFGTAHRGGLENFLMRAKIRHGDRYDYSNSKYTGYHSPIEVKCVGHDFSFYPSPANHLSSGTGCPRCRESKGEALVCKTLKELGVYHEREKSFESLKMVKRLRYDFYIPERNLLLEYNGKQHYTHHSWASKEGLEYIKRKDRIKEKWAKDNGYCFTAISYKRYSDIPLIVENIIKGYEAL